MIYKFGSHTVEVDGNSISLDGRPPSGLDYWMSIEGGYACRDELAAARMYCVVMTQFHIVAAARDLAAKKIGFSEFKRVIRENS